MKKAEQAVINERISNSWDDVWEAQRIGAVTWSRLRTCHAEVAHVGCFYVLALARYARSALLYVHVVALLYAHIAALLCVHIAVHLHTAIRVPVHTSTRTTCTPSYFAFTCLITGLTNFACPSV